MAVEFNRAKLLESDLKFKCVRAVATPASANVRAEGLELKRGGLTILFFGGLTEFNEL